MFAGRIYPSSIGSYKSLAAGKQSRLVHKTSLTQFPRPEAQILTKGDNNPSDDTTLYAEDQRYLQREDIIGSVVGYIPFVGYVTILLSEHPWLKTVMLGLMGLVVVLQRE
jgi:signal peptidase